MTRILRVFFVHYIFEVNKMFKRKAQIIIGPEHEEFANSDIVKMYSMSIEQFNSKINDIKSKAQKAMRVTLWLKLLITLSSIYSISAWLNDHHHANIWALILVISEVAGVLLDTLPYFQQRIELPKLKLSLEHVYFELIQDYCHFERGEIDEKEALRRYWSHRKAWVKAVG